MPRAPPKAKDIDFEGGLTLLPDRAYVNYKGPSTKSTRPPSASSSRTSNRLSSAGRSEANPADVTACQEAATGLKVGDFVENLTNEGSADVDGTSTTKISGDLNVGGTIDAIIKLTENPACSSQLEAAGPLPIGELEKAKSELTSAVKRAHVEVYVGDDNIIRKLEAEMTIEPKSSKTKKSKSNSISRSAASTKNRTSRRPPAPSRSKGCSRSSTSTRSNCSKGQAAAKASATCSKA